MSDTTDSSEIRDITIVGAGPAGLAAAYYAGHRHASVRIIDTLPELGGQVMAIYPEKHIHDVAGFPSIKGLDLCAQLVEQAMQFDPDVVLDENCERLEYEPSEEGVGIIRLTGSSGTVYRTRALIITAGHGAFEHRALPVDDIDDWTGRGLHYIVRAPSVFADRRVVIVGGGDSAVDWAIHLAESVAAPLVLVHRRDRFRAIDSSVARLRDLAAAGAVDVRVPCEVTSVRGADRIESVIVTDRETGLETPVLCDDLITLLGFKSALGSIADWGLEFDGKRSIHVDQLMHTNLPNVFAAGDIAHYPGRINLITVGMGEAAIAANQAIAQIRPGEKAQPKYSTD